MSHCKRKEKEKENRVIDMSIRKGIKRNNYTSATLTHSTPRSTEFSTFPIQQTSALGILYHYLVHPPLTESQMKITLFPENRHINKPWLMIQLQWLKLPFRLFRWLELIGKHLQLWSEMATKMGDSRILRQVLSWRSMHFNYFEMFLLHGILFITWYVASNTCIRWASCTYQMFWLICILTGCQ